MTKSNILKIIQSPENNTDSTQVEYKFVEFNKYFTDEISISDKIFRDTLDSKDLETVESRAKIITTNGGENRSKILCYLTEKKTLDQIKTKVKLSEYACHNVAISKKNFVSGVIVLCKTSDDKFIIGSRDASRAKDDPQDYFLQAPCGFMENYEIGNELAFDKLKDRSLSFKEFVIENGIKELKEEILPFEDHEIDEKELIGGIFVVRQWPKKNLQDPDQSLTKNIANFKSFIVVTKVSLSFKEIQQLRQTSRQPKDFHEITLIEGLSSKQINEQSSERKPIEIAIDFDGKSRKFAAEHCLVLPIANYLCNQKENSPHSSLSVIEISSLETNKGSITKVR